MDRELESIFKCGGFNPGAGGPALACARIGTPLGDMVAAAVPEGLCLLEFLDRPDLSTQLATLRRFYPLPFNEEKVLLLDTLRSQLDDYFHRKSASFSLPLALHGTAFQERVWAGLRGIPWGATRSYGELARDIGAPTAVRALAGANARNRIAIIIPCHRVIPASGRAAGGYAGGSWRKEALLALEAGG